jgi:hypothetical protein
MKKKNEVLNFESGHRRSTLALGSPINSIVATLSRNVTSAAIYWHTFVDKSCQ